MMGNVLQPFLEQVRRQPERVAILAGEEAISYEALWQQARQTASYFQAKGIGPGDRVLLFVPVSIDLYRIVIALFQLGAVAVFLDEWAGMKRLQACCKASDCKGFVASRKGRWIGRLIGPIRKIPIWLSDRPFASYPAQTALFEATSDDQALITFTTGTTGMPKGADRTHGFLQAQLRALSMEIPTQPGEVCMPSLPIFTFFNLANGCTTVLPSFSALRPEKMAPETIWQEIKKHQVARIIASPFFVLQLAQYCLEATVEIPAALREIWTGGAPVFPPDAAKLEQAFPQVASTIVYGSTEAEPISSIAAKDLARLSVEDGLPVGNIFPETQLRIISITPEPLDAEQLHLCSAGQIGEILVAGPHVLPGYFRNAPANRQHKIPIGGQVWHRTGDSGFVNAEGALFLTGRCSSLIEREAPGRYFAPFVEESKLRSIPEVELGTILQQGTKLILFVELRSPLPKAALQQEIDRLQIPHDEIRILERMPRDKRHFSRIDYAALKEQAMSLL